MESHWRDKFTFNIKPFDLSSSNKDFFFSSHKNLETSGPLAVVFDVRTSILVASLAFLVHKKHYQICNSFY